MSETNLAPPPANSAEARTETGEIKPNPTLSPESEVKSEVKAEGEVKDGKTLLTDEKKPEAKADAGAPEKYESFTLPEGFTMDEAVTKEASALFKGLGLSQTQAQSLVDFHTAKTKAAAEGPVNLWKEQQDKWKTEIKADPEIGGKLDQVKTTVSKAIDGLGDPKLATAFREAMDYTGAGNNPAFIRAFYKLAQKVTEGGHVPGRGPVSVSDPTAKPRSAAAAMFPHLP